LVRRTQGLAPGLAPPVEATRARVELSRRKQAAVSATERWHTAGVELARLLRLEPAVLVEPQEPPDLTVTLVHPAWPVDDLIPIALTNRPELAARQALVQATLQRSRRFQALAQATADYFATVGDFNQAQFRLYRALGHPAQCVTNGVMTPALTPLTPARGRKREGRAGPAPRVPSHPIRDFSPNHQAIHGALGPIRRTSTSSRVDRHGLTTADSVRVFPVVAASRLTQ